LIRLAAPLHDIGKIGIADEILRAPRQLTSEEFNTMKSHVLIGSQILSGSASALLQMAETIALYHHERWDGAGYCAGLKGDAIPLPARIVSVADTFDALTHERPYKRVWTLKEAMAEIASLSGSMFDPRVVSKFAGLVSSAALNLDTVDDLPAGGPLQGHLPETPWQVGWRQELTSHR
jgi:putative two-component system response regulator